VISEKKNPSRLI